jgi:phosphoribosylglycinamide formyltransferase-1
MKKKLIIFASGTKTGGGSGFANLVKASRNGQLEAEIILVVSSHENGGVRNKADALGIPFKYFPGPYTAENYQAITDGADFVSLSGWLKMVRGLNPQTTFNIHPGDTKKFGGPGMYGHYVHEAVMEAYHRGEVTNSAVTMHFVTEKYDEGPVFFQIPVEILPSDTPETLGERVLNTEHTFQPVITNAVLEGRIRWDGKTPESLVTLD